MLSLRLLGGEHLLFGALFFIGVGLGHGVQEFERLGLDAWLPFDIASVLLKLGSLDCLLGDVFQCVEARCH